MFKMFNKTGLNSIKNRSSKFEQSLCKYTQAVKSVAAAIKFPREINSSRIHFMYQNILLRITARVQSWIFNPDKNLDQY